MAISALKYGIEKPTDTANTNVVTYLTEVQEKFKAHDSTLIDDLSKSDHLKGVELEIAPIVDLLFKSTLIEKVNKPIKRQFGISS